MTTIIDMPDDVNNFIKGMSSWVKTIIIGVVVIALIVGMVVGIVSYFSESTNSEDDKKIVKESDFLPPISEQESKSMKEQPMMMVVRDRVIFYIFRSLDTPEKMQQACQNWKPEFEKTIDTLYTNKARWNFVAESYLQICEYKMTVWTQQDEQKWLERGGEPLTEEEIKNEINPDLVTDFEPQSAKADYCEALRQWNEDYEGIEWLTEETINEYEKVCK